MRIKLLSIIEYLKNGSCNCQRYHNRSRNFYTAIEILNMVKRLGKECWKFLEFFYEWIFMMMIMIAVII